MLLEDLHAAGQTFRVALFLVRVKRVDVRGRELSLNVLFLFLFRFVRAVARARFARVALGV